MLGLRCDISDEYQCRKNSTTTTSFLTVYIILHTLLTQLSKLQNIQWLNMLNFSSALHNVKTSTSMKAWKLLMKGWRGLIGEQRKLWNTLQSRNSSTEKWLKTVFKIKYVWDTSEYCWLFHFSLEMLLSTKRGCIRPLWNLFHLHQLMMKKKINK